MREIQGKAKTIRELLKGIKYTIDYYQREYKWESKQIRDLIQDLSGKFLEDYEQHHTREAVAEYGHYFLGSIIISKKDTNYIVDGQQRLTSLTLLLIFLRNLQQERPEAASVDELIFSERYGRKSFNMAVDERVPCMNALFEGRSFDATDKAESVQNIVARYNDIEDCFPEDLQGNALPYFIDWLIENVHLVEITAYSDDDAYTIFETMNDRGLSLSPTDMLKGFLLANISDDERKTLANSLWRGRVLKLSEQGKEVDSDFFKAWLRSQYATKIRERRKNAKAEDFDRIGTEFHRWIRDARSTIGLVDSDDVFEFIDRDFDFYSRQYLRITEASRTLVPGMERVLYNAHHGFTLQPMLLLAPLTPEDDQVTALRKIGLVSGYLDIMLTWRLWNFRSIAYSTMQYAMFVVMRDIRGLPPEVLATVLRDKLNEQDEVFASNDRLSMHQQNRRYLHRILARIIDYIERESGQAGRYMEYVNETGKNRYEVEHIWADKPDRHAKEFPSQRDFADYRNRIGGLLLLPKKFNASYGALTYEEKLSHYYGRNLLASSLHSQCYERNPGFTQFVSESGLPFQPHQTFKKSDLDERGELYRQIAERLWEPDRILEMQP